jgi:cytochrome d ubiquinol oxidase subunit I
VAIGSNLSALWILVANSWMQHPVGMVFNPDSARFEMQNFREVLFSPVAVSKFTHTTSSSFIVGSLFVITVSSWYLLKGRNTEMAKKSILVASVFGLLACVYAGLTGDESAYVNASTQPMKLAAYEGLYNGKTHADLVAFGVLKPEPMPGGDPFLFDIKLPGLLSLLANRDAGSFVPGIKDLVYGNDREKVVGVTAKMERGRMAIADLAAYKNAKKRGDTAGGAIALQKFNANKDFLGYGYFAKPEDSIPPVQTTFYSFHLMVSLGCFFTFFFLVFLYLGYKDALERHRWLLQLGFVSFFLGMLASQAGWVVAEVGRQPWVIQNYLPTHIGTSNISAGNVQATFFMFLGLFTLLLLAEVKIMLKQINIGPEEV